MTQWLNRYFLVGFFPLLFLIIERFIRSIITLIATSYQKCSLLNKARTLLSSRVVVFRRQRGLGYRFLHRQ